MTFFASIFPILCWLGYNLGVPFIEARRPSLSVIMSMQRRRWVANAAKRETPVDAILAGNLMQSVSFLASTSVLIVLALFAAFGQLPSLMRALATFGFANDYTAGEMQLHLLVLLAIFASSFFAFTLSLRQFNHFCIMLGALSHQVPATEEEIAGIAMLNSLAAKNFNSGIRAFYFAVPAVAWFASPWLSIAVTVVMTAFIIHREFFSSAHRVAASVAVIASRREHKVEETKP
jgi:uncharacterized membrane protein